MFIFLIYFDLNFARKILRYFFSFLRLGGYCRKPFLHLAWWSWEQLWLTKQRNYHDVDNLGITGKDLCESTAHLVHVCWDSFKSGYSLKFEMCFLLRSGGRIDRAQAVWIIWILPPFISIHTSTCITVNMCCINRIMNKSGKLPL